MRPVTVFVLLLFASGVVGGELYGQTLAAQRLAQLPAQDRAAPCTRCVVARTAVPVCERSVHGRSPVVPWTRHRRSVARGILPAPRAPDPRPEIA